MKPPVMVLSYGNFSADNKKLFFYEDNEKSIFPIFTDLQVAINFRKYMSKILKKHKDNRVLEIQICNNEQYLRDILTIVSISNIQIVIIDPIPPDNKRKTIAGTKKTIEKILSKQKTL